MQDKAEFFKKIKPSNLPASTSNLPDNWEEDIDNFIHKVYPNYSEHIDSISHLEKILMVALMNKDVTNGRIFNTPDAEFKLNYIYNSHIYEHYSIADIPRIGQRINPTQTPDKYYSTGRKHKIFRDNEKNESKQGKMHGKQSHSSEGN
jgi:hypothetical protein